MDVYTLPIIDLYLLKVPIVFTLGLFFQTPEWEVSGNTHLTSDYYNRNSCQDSRFRSRYRKDGTVQMIKMVIYFTTL
jgi:hypothetical protein